MKAKEGRGSSHNCGVGGSKWRPGGSLDYRVVADSHHFDEKQDPNPDPLKVKRWTRIRIKMKRGNRIRIKVMLTRRP
jgi:hypothetical protein